MAEKKLKVTLLKSPYGRKVGHKECVRGLGLKRQRDSRVLADTKAVRGMIAKVSYLVKCEGEPE